MNTQEEALIKINKITDQIQDEDLRASLIEVITEEIDDIYDMYLEAEKDLKDSQEEIDELQEDREIQNIEWQTELDEANSQFDDYEGLPEFKSAGDADTFNRIMNVYPLITNEIILNLESKV